MSSEAPRLPLKSDTEKERVLKLRLPLDPGRVISRISGTQPRAWVAFRRGVSAWHPSCSRRIAAPRGGPLELVSRGRHPGQLETG